MGRISGFLLLFPFEGDGLGILNLGTCTKGYMLYHLNGVIDLRSGITILEGTLILVGGNGKIWTTNHFEDGNTFSDQKVVDDINTQIRGGQGPIID